MPELQLRNVYTAPWPKDRWDHNQDGGQGKTKKTRY